jgi:hypothetical protein
MPKNEDLPRLRAVEPSTPPSSANTPAESAAPHEGGKPAGATPTKDGPLNDTWFSDYFSPNVPTPLAKMGRAVEVALNKIVLDPSAQARERMSEETIAWYAELDADGVELDPLTGFGDPDVLVYLGDGGHRKRAYEKNGRETARVLVFPGGLEQARAYAAGANAKSTLPLTQEDRRRAVRMALSIPHLKDQPATFIAQWCGVSDKLVTKVRDELGLARPHAKAKRSAPGPTPTSAPRAPVGHARNATDARTSPTHAAATATEVAGNPADADADPIAGGSHADSSARTTTGRTSPAGQGAVLDSTSSSESPFTRQLMDLAVRLTPQLEVRITSDPALSAAADELRRRLRQFSDLLDELPTSRTVAARP